MKPELEDAVWRFLPGRPDRRRVTAPNVIAANLDISPMEAGEALLNLERQGRIVRESKNGRDGWHRVAPAAEPEPDGPDLFSADGAA